MHDRLRNKVIVVTGAASGIGRAIGTRCVAEGARVLFTDRDATGAAAAAAESGGGANAASLVCDVHDRAQVDAAIDAAVARWGRLDGVAANAGGSGGKSRNLIDVPEDEWLDIVDLNLSGTFRTLQAAARVMVAQGEGGAMMATGSSTGIRPMVGRYAYLSSKAAVHQLVRALALELGEHRIRVNALVPGVTDTPAIHRYPGHAERSAAAAPLGVLIEPDELGALGAYLLSDEARSMTGSVVTLDAGRCVA
ncbi:MAG: SDR family oxidoreductase [Alphaproteobacteria bacterium]|jgi:NAD(P)-dependent dehydrogenase (short-subunit alcohol dehydrogenase family)